jgi:plastocyanin
MRFAGALILGTALSALAACGGGGGGGANSCTPGPTASLSITSTGLSPINVCVEPGGTVTFTNSDMATTHDIEFDSPGCPMNSGDIPPGGGMVNVTFPTQGNCSFHDGKNASNAAFKGTVAVTSVIVSGGGY